MGLLVSAYGAVVDQAGFRGSLGITSTSDYLLDDYNQYVSPTNNAMSYGIGMGYRYASGFYFELDYVGSSNKYNTDTLNNACTGSDSPCVYTACTNDFSTNPPTTTCTGYNMAAPATTTGETVSLTGTEPSKGTPTSTEATTDTSTTGTLTTTTTTVNYTGTSSSTTEANSGYVSVSSLMLNTIYQFSPQTKFNPYFGYGVGYAESTAGFGITTTPINTTVSTVTISTTDTGNNSTTTPTSVTTYVSSTEADDGTQTLTETTSSFASQMVFGAEIRFDTHNTLDLRVVKRYVKIPDVTALVANGTPYPSIGVTTTTNGVTTSTIGDISASTMTFEIGLLYYA